MKHRVDDDPMALTRHLIDLASDAYAAGERERCINLIERIYALHSDDSEPAAMSQTERAMSLATSLISKHGRKLACVIGSSLSAMYEIGAFEALGVF